METEKINIKQINTDHGRFYQTPEGKTYPSVTTITGIICEEAISEWRKKVGEEKANEICCKASNKGTRFHALMEEILTTGKIPSCMIVYEEFVKVLPLIKEKILPHLSNVRFVEHMMYGDSIQAAGTVDLVADFYGKLAVCDWKTSSHHKTVKDVTNYWCQCAAYAIMLKERYNLDVEKLVLFINEGDKDVYVLSQDAEPWMYKFGELREVFRKKKGY